MKPSKIKEQRPISVDRHPQSENEYKSTIVKWIGIFMSFLLLVLAVPIFSFSQKIADDISGADLMDYLAQGAFWMSGLLGGVSVTLLSQKALKIFLKEKQF